jgi:hypothetical protein
MVAGDAVALLAGLPSRCDGRRGMNHSAPLADAKTVPIAAGITQPNYPLSALEPPQPYVPTSTKSPEEKREQKKHWFRNGQKWRTGCEGRSSVAKRRHGLSH